MAPRTVNTQTQMVTGKSVPGVTEMTEIKQQDHDDVFHHKQHVGDQLHNSQFFLQGHPTRI